MTIRDNVLEVRERMTAACRSAGRDPSDVLLVAVSKTFPAEAVREAIAAGVTVFGENKVQEAAAKIPIVEAPAGITWHMIGHLQRNKAKAALGLFDLIQTVDGVRLARVLQQYAEAEGRVLPVLLEVNIGDEPSKSGVRPQEALRLAEEIGGMRNLRLRGLMAIPPFTEDPEDSRPTFAGLRGLRDEISAVVGPLPDLSMGMSHDFEQAIREGATMVRVGSSIFGVRPVK